MDNFILENYLTDLTICDDLIEWFYDKSEFHQPGKLYLTAEGEGQPGVDTQRKASTDSVSYTHLTLPTILRV